MSRSNGRTLRTPQHLSTIHTPLERHTFLWYSGTLGCPILKEKIIGFNPPKKGLLKIIDLKWSTLEAPYIFSGCSYDQWEFQDPKMEVLYHISGHILLGYSLKFRPSSSALYMAYGRLQWMGSWRGHVPIIFSGFSHGTPPFLSNSRRRGWEPLMSPAWRTLQRRSAGLMRRPNHPSWMTKL